MAMVLLNASLKVYLRDKQEKRNLKTFDRATSFLTGLDYTN